MMMIKMEKYSWKQLLCWLKRYPKSTLLIFELLWLAIFLSLYPYPMVSPEIIDTAPDPKFALIFSTAIALVVSVLLRPIVKKIYLELSKRGMIDNGLGVVPFLISYLAALFITSCLSFASIKVFSIQNIIWLETLMQVFLFLLSIALFSAYSRCDKKQYGFYAAIYFFSTIAEWHRNWIVQSFPEINSTLDFIISFFVTPSKEAMLLFTIWDNYPRKQNCGLEQIQDISKPHSAQRKPNTPKRKKRKNR